ncbi:MAG: hypothetical protein ACRCTZ_16735 [Sarcina sp.]
MSKKLLSICMTAAFAGILTANMYMPQNIQHLAPAQATPTVSHHSDDSNKPSLENANEIKNSLEENLNESEISISHHIHKLI